MKAISLLLVSLFFASVVCSQSTITFEKYKMHIENNFLNSSNTTRTRTAKQRLLVDSSYINDGTGFKFFYADFYFYTNERGCIQAGNENGRAVNCQSDSSFGYSFYDETDKYVNKYNAQNNLTENISFDYNQPVQEFTPMYKSVISYNVMNKINTASYFEYIVNFWQPVTSVYYHYNAGNQLERKLETRFYFNSWDSTTKYEFAYIADNITAFDEYTFVNNTWKIKVKNTYSYTPQNKVNQQQKYSNWTGTFFKDTTIVTYLYDTLNRVDSINYTTLSYNDSVPYVTSRKYTYNGPDTNMNSFTSYSNGIINNKIEYSYDVNNNLINMKHYSFHQPNAYNQYINYYYENYNITSIDKRESAFSDFLLYPNPANTSVTLIISTKCTQDAAINLSDVSGRSVYFAEEKCNAGMNNISIPVQNLARGIYLVNLSSGGQKIKSVKFVKE